MSIQRDREPSWAVNTTLTSFIPGGPPPVFNMFSGVRARGKCRLTVQIQITGTATIQLFLSDGLTSPGLTDNLTTGFYSYEFRWGADASQLLVPSGGSASSLIAGTYFGKTVGMSADLNIGGHPDFNGALSAGLIVSASGSVVLNATANLITWDE
jgi:hypothetical protein